MTPSFAYLAQGKLYLKRGDAPVREIESRFGEEVRQRALQIQDRNAWKTQGTGARFMRGGLWAQPDQDPAALRIAISGVSQGCESGDLLYALETDEIAGVFRLCDDATQEQRLLHTSDYRVRHLHAQPGSDRVACVVLQPRGGSAIAVMRADGSDLSEVTQGDTSDEAPRWLPGSATELVFQSAGLARNANGFVVGRGPYGIQRLDIERGELTSVAEDPTHDLLAPQLAVDGALYYIRRPYRSPVERASAARGALELALFPVRLLFAFFQYLNFFTVRYTGKPLTTAGDAQQRSADLRQMMVWGNLIDAQKAARRAPRGDDAPALVPPSWELVRQRGGAMEVVGKSVLAFDLAADGAVLFSNGSAVYRLGGDGQTERLLKHAGIEQVIALA